MEQNAKIGFEGVDNGISSFIKRLREDTKSLYSDFASEAKKQSTSQRDQIKIIEDQIKALERANALEQQQTKIILDRKRSAGSISPQQYAAGRAQLQEDKGVQRLQSTVLKDLLSEGKQGQPAMSGVGGAGIAAAVVGANLGKLQQDSKSIYEEFEKNAKKKVSGEREQLKIVGEQIKTLERKSYIERETARETLEEQKRTGDEKKRNEAEQGLEFLKVQEKKDKVTLASLKDRYEDDKSKLPEERKSVFSEIMKAGLVRDLMGMFKQATSAQTGLDLLPSMFGISGAGAGSAIGSIAEALTAGQMDYAIVGAQLGKEIGQTAGQGIVRHITEQERYQASAFGVRAMTGQGSQATSLSQFGMDLASAAQLEQQMVKATGHAVKGQDIGDVAAISKFANIDIGSIMQLLGTRRMGAEVSEDRIIGLFREGIDRSVLGEMTQNLTGMITHLSQSSATPNALMASQMLMEANKIGGPFSAHDPRSLGLVSAYHDRISNPQGGFAQALSYSVLRRQNPDADAYELLKLQQTGSPQHQRGILDSVAGMTSSGSLNKLLFSQLFGTGKYEFDEMMFDGRKNINSMEGKRTTIEMGAQTRQEVYSEASQLTTQMQKDIASVNDAFVSGFLDGIDTITVQFKNRFMRVIEDMIKEQVGFKTNRKGGVPAKQGVPEMY